MYKIRRVSGHDEFVSSFETLERAEMSYHFENESGYLPYSYAQLAYDESGIWVHMRSDEVRENLRAEVTEPNGETYKDSCMELFFVALPECGSTEYFNFEINVIGTVHIGFGGLRQNRRLLANSDSRAFLRVEAARSIEECGEHGWGIVYYIPFSLIAEHAEGFCVKPGARMTGNFYKIGDLTPRPHHLMWSNIDMPQPNFHQPSFFGDWIFE